MSRQQEPTSKSTGDTEFELDVPVRGTRYINDSVHRSTPGAVPLVLSRLARKLVASSPFQLSFAYLDHPICSDDNRAQITVELFKATKPTAALKDVTVGSASMNVAFATEKVTRLIVSLPVGEHHEDLPVLLELASRKLRELGDIDVLDLFISTLVTNDNTTIGQVVIYYT